MGTKYDKNRVVSAYPNNSNEQKPLHILNYFVAAGAAFSRFFPPIASMIGCRTFCHGCFNFLNEKR